MTVLEINASGGWYTEIIAPVVAGTGKYYATLTDPNISERSQNSFNSHLESVEANSGIYGDVELVGIGPGNMEPIESGSADLVLTFRNIHNWMASDTIGDMLDMMYDAAKPGGHLGIVEHRGNPMVKQDAKAQTGYVNEGHTIKLAEDSGLAVGGYERRQQQPKWTIRITKAAFGVYRQHCGILDGKAFQPWKERTVRKV